MPTSRPPDPSSVDDRLTRWTEGWSNGWGRDARPARAEHWAQLSALIQAGVGVPLRAWAKGRAAEANTDAALVFARSVALSDLLGALAAPDPATATQVLCSPGMLARTELQALIAHGADPGRTLPSKGRSPLFWAVQEGPIERVYDLLAAGASVQSLPKHWPVLIDNTSVFERWTAAGCPASGVNAEGLNVVQAALKTSPWMALGLLEHTAQHHPDLWLVPGPRGVSAYEQAQRLSSSPQRDLAQSLARVSAWLDAHLSRLQAAVLHQQTPKLPRLSDRTRL